MMYLYGKNSVFERLKANPKSIKKIFLQDNFTDISIEKIIKSAKVSVGRLSQKGLYKIKPVVNSQGIVAEVEEFKYAYFTDLINNTEDSKLSLILLDRIFDPQNLGAIIRTSACFGNFAIVIPKHKACSVTETVLHIACGGENYVPVAVVSNLTNAILDAKKNGWWVVGSVIEGGQSIIDAKLPFPLCFILGTEGQGIRYGIEKHLDSKVHIPMKGAALSFNVAAASIIFCHEITKQKRKV